MNFRHLGSDTSCDIRKVTDVGIRDQRRDSIPIDKLDPNGYLTEA